MRNAHDALRLLISAGPTREPIDPARFLSNYSTGYMGAQLARQALTRGHRVTMVCGPVSEPMPARARVIPVEDAHAMARALRAEAPRADAILMAAAVSDFRPARLASMKLRRRARRVLVLEGTPDIIATLPRRTGQVIVGFALETDHTVARAWQKLKAKRLDVLLAQQANGTGSPFGRRRVHAWLLSRDGSTTALGTASKARVARVLLDKVEALWYGQRKPDRRRTTIHAAMG